jgi:hypothetical protein
MNESQCIRAIELLAMLYAEQEGIEIEINVKKKDECGAVNQSTIVI